MKLFKDKVTEKLWVEMCEGGNLMDFAGHSYDGDIGELVEVNTDPNNKDYTNGKTGDVNERCIYIRNRIKL